MIIEFIGPPASGKSTIEAELIANINEVSTHRWTHKKSRDMILNAGRSLLSDHQESITLFKRLLRTCQDRAHYYPYLWVYGTSLFYFIDSCPDGGICVLDQGPIQYLWGIGISGTIDNEISDYILDRIHSFEQEYIIVDVQIGVNELQRRLNDRDNGSRIKAFHRESFERGIQLSRKLSNICENESSVHHLTVDGEAPPESNVNEILEKISMPK